jgi:hypothetical protein
MLGIILLAGCGGDNNTTADTSNNIPNSADPETTPEPESDLVRHEVNQGIFISYSPEKFNMDEDGYRMTGTGEDYLFIAFLHNLNVDFEKEADNLINNNSAAETETTIGGFTARKFTYEKYGDPAVTYIIRYDKPVDAYYEGKLVGQYDGVIINVYADNKEDIDGSDVMNLLNSYTIEQ